MNLTAAKGDLSLAVAMLAAALNPKHSVPILRNVLVSASEDDISFRATDLDQQVTARAKVKVTERGIGGAIDGARLQRLAGTLDGKAAIKIRTDGTDLVLQSGRARHIFKSARVKDFPAPMAVGDGACAVSLDADAWRRLLEPPASILSVNDGRPTGVALRVADGRLTALAANSFQSIRTSVAVPDLAFAGAVIPRDACLFISGMTRMVRIRFSANLVEAVSESCQYTAKLISPEHQPQAPRLPTETANSFEIDGFELAASVKRPAAVAGSAPSPMCQLWWGASDHELSLATHQEFGDCTDSVPIGNVCGSGAINLAILPLLKLLAAVGNDRVRVDIGTERPALRISKPNDPGFVAVQMAMVAP
jgi:DNA polymerase-3 subunit beta